MRLKLDDISKMLNKKHNCQPKDKDYIGIDDIEIKIDEEQIELMESNEKFDTFILQFDAYNKKTGEYIVGDEWEHVEKHDGRIDNDFYIANIERFNSPDSKLHEDIYNYYEDHIIPKFKREWNSNLELLNGIKWVVVSYLDYE